MNAKRARKSRRHHRLDNVKLRNELALLHATCNGLRLPQVGWKHGMTIDQLETKVDELEAQVEALLQENRNLRAYAEKEWDEKFWEDYDLGPMANQCKTCGEPDCGLSMGNVLGDMFSFCSSECADKFWASEVGQEATRKSRERWNQLVGRCN